jgi:hypothetical protein
VTAQRPVAGNCDEFDVGRLTHADDLVPPLRLGPATAVGPLIKVFDTKPLAVLCHLTCYAKI